MEFWQTGRIENGYGEEGIILKGGGGRIISKTEEGIKFTEECDGFFDETYTREDALRVVDELRAWISAT